MAIAETDEMIQPVDVFGTSEWSQGVSDGRVDNLIDGSGLSGVGPIVWQIHDDRADASSMWHAGDVDAGLGGPLGTPPEVASQSVVFDLGVAYDLVGAYVWNHNQQLLTDRGVQNFEIHVSAGENPLKAVFSPVASFDLLQAGSGAFERAQRLSFSAADVRLVRFDIVTAHSGSLDEFVGLSEVRFLGELSDIIFNDDFASPDPPEFGTDDTVNGEVVPGQDAGDTLMTAHSVLLDQTEDTLVTGSTGFDTDEADFYAFTAFTSGTVTVELSGLSDDLDLVLFDTTSVLAVSETAGGSTEQIAFEVSSDTNYFIAVQPWQSARSNYELLIDIDLPEPTDDTVNGQLIPGGDAGNTQLEGHPIDLGREASALISGFVGFGSDSQDYYSFVAPESGAARFDLTGLDEDLDLFLEAGTVVLAASENGGVTAESITFEVNQGEMYFVAVQPFGRSKYGLSIVLPRLKGDDDIVNGELVPGGDAGDTLGQGYSVDLDPAGDAAISGSTGFRDDSADYYLFVAPRSGAAMFDLSGLDENLDLVLLTSAGALLASSTSAGTEPEAITTSVIKSDTYVLGVTPVGNRRSNYDLAIVLPEREPASMMVNDVTVVEDDGSLTFTLTRSSDSEAASVDYSINQGTAETPADYTGILANAVDFSIGDFSATVTVDIVDDAIFEGTEQFTIDLFNPVNLLIVDSQGVGTILDNDQAPKSQ